MENAQIIKSLYSAINAQDWNKAQSCFADNAEFKDISFAQSFHGPQSIKAMMETWAKGMPDMKFEIADITASGDTCCTQMTISGTHKGPIKAAYGTIAATGKKISVPTCDIIKMKNGKIQSINSYQAATIFMSQIGAPATTAFAAAATPTAAFAAAPSAAFAASAASAANAAASAANVRHIAS